MYFVTCYLHTYILPTITYKGWNYSIGHFTMLENDKQTMRRFLERHGGKCV